MIGCRFGQIEWHSFKSSFVGTSICIFERLLVSRTDQYDMVRNVLQPYTALSLGY